MNNFQRRGSISNAQVGAEFENIALEFLSREGIGLSKKRKVLVGIENKKKNHTFDLGSDSLKIIVECKSHTWTSSGNVPSAKLTVWNEAMYYFVAAPSNYRKILFVLKDVRACSTETLAEYYIRTYSHLIPRDVEIWEYDTSLEKGKSLNTSS